MFISRIGRIAITISLWLAASFAISDSRAASYTWFDFYQHVKVKKVVADAMTSDQLHARKIQLAQLMADRANRGPKSRGRKTVGDTCGAATNEVGTLPYTVPGGGTTVGQTDDYDLPADTTNPTCTAAIACTGTGPAGSLPRGAIYTGTGTGADVAYKIRTDANCTVTVTMDPTGAQDLALLLFPGSPGCSNNLTDCGCASDTGIGGGAETILFDAVAGQDYFVVVDGYSTGAIAPGPSGPFSLSFTTTGSCNFVPAVASADLSITKTDGVASIAPGLSTTYTIVASNAGPSPVTDAAVVDTFPPGCSSVSWSSTAAGGASGNAANGTGNINETGLSIPIGGSITYLATCNIDAAATGSLENTATISSVAVADPTPANNTATDADTLTPSADLGITKTDGVATATPGGSTTYTIVASNMGPSVATGVTVADTFPAACTAMNWTSVAAGGATGNTANGTGNINDGAVTLPPGGSVTYTATCTIDAAATGSLVNTATISSAITDINPADNTATDTDTLTLSADLGITKTDGVATATPGGSTTYTIVASNNGPSAATGVTVADTFPAACTAMSWTSVAAGGATGNTANGTGNINDGAVTLPPGGTVTYTATCTIDAAATGSLVNTATISSALPDSVPSNNSATDTDTLGASGNLSINMTANPTSLSGGGNIVFTVVAANSGPSSATAAQVTTSISNACLNLTWTCVGAGGGVCPAANGVGNVAGVANLAAGSSVTFSLTCNVPASYNGSVSASAAIDGGIGFTEANTADNGSQIVVTANAARLIPVPALGWAALVGMGLLLLGVAWRRQGRVL